MDVILGYLLITSAIAFVASLAVAMSGGGLAEAIAVHFLSGGMVFAALVARALVTAR